MISIKSDINDLFQVFYIYGLASILEQQTEFPVTVHWDSSRAYIVCGKLDLADAASQVSIHATRCMSENWITSKTASGPKDTLNATLSPRVMSLTTNEDQKKWQEARWRAIDQIAEIETLDWRFVGALGEPYHWGIDMTPSQQKFGASSWEMVARNKGNEFIRNRLLPLAEAVSRREIRQIEDGLSGSLVEDEVGKNEKTSRTPTGLRVPSRADNAVAWCALMALSMFPTRPVSPRRTQLTPRSHSAGSALVKGTTWFFVPIATRPVTLGRVRAAMRSEALDTFGRANISANISTREILMNHDLVAHSKISASREWLNSHGFGGVVIARKHYTDSNSPESWAITIARRSTAKD